MSTPIPQRTLGHNGLKVGSVGYGCMMMTWCDPKDVTPDEQAFDAIKTAITSGATFLNSGIFYNHPSQPYANIKLLGRFFDKYPELAEGVVLSVKGASKGGNPHNGPDASYENMKYELEQVREHLGKNKSLDLYEPARVDPNRTIEEVMQDLVKLKNEGLFKEISLSEIHPDTIRKALKIHPIAAVEIEFSLFSMDPEAKEIVKLAEQEGFGVVAYSPLGKGMLTGAIKSPDDIPEGDMRKMSPRFQGENFKVNMEIVEKLNELAKDKGVTAGQLALAYILAYSDKLVPIPGSSSTKRTAENIEAGNVKLDKSDIQAIDEVLSKFEVAGTRYPEFLMKMNYGRGKE